MAAKVAAAPTVSGSSDLSALKPGEAVAGAGLLALGLKGCEDGQADGMKGVCWGSDAGAERPEVTVRGYRRFRCRACGQQFTSAAAAC